MSCICCGPLCSHRFCLTKKKNFSGETVCCSCSVDRLDLRKTFLRTNSFAELDKLPGSPHRGIASDTCCCSCCTTVKFICCAVGALCCLCSTETVPAAMQHQALQCLCWCSYFGRHHIHAGACTTQYVRKRLQIHNTAKQSQPSPPAHNCPAALVSCKEAVQCPSWQILTCLEKFSSMMMACAGVTTAA